MKLNDRALKALKKHLNDFNKNGHVKLTEEEINAITEQMAEGDDMKTIAKNCRLFINKATEKVTEKMDKAIHEGRTAGFDGLPEKMDDFVSRALHDIVYTTYHCEERDIVVSYMSGGLSGTNFAEYASDILNQKNYKLSDAAMLDVQMKMKNGQSETEALFQVTNTLNELTKPVKAHFVDKTEPNYQATNDDFNDFLKQISVSYNAVHEMYNQKSFIGKWFTPSGWMLRSAMNSAKECVKAYYNDLAAKNIREEVEPDDLFEEYITPGVDNSSTEKISHYLKDFSEGSRVQITINDDGTLETDTQQTDFHNDLDQFLLPDAEVAPEDMQHTPDNLNQSLSEEDNELDL